MKVSLFLLFILLFNIGTAHAQSFKVIKKVGNRAVVEFSDPNAFNMNETYSIGSTTKLAATGYKRDYGLSTDFSYITQSNPSSSQLSLNGVFLWNMKTYEVGPILQLVNTSSGGFNTSSTGFGAVGYYNFTENKVGQEHILSAIAQIVQSSGSGTSSTSLAAGGNYRWFVLSGDHAFTFSALYRTVQVSGASVSGFALTGGIATYF